jgi:hypothetical protein
MPQGLFMNYPYPITLYVLFYVLSIMYTRSDAILTKGSPENHRSPRLNYQRQGVETSDLKTITHPNTRLCKHKPHLRTYAYPPTLPAPINTRMPFLSTQLTHSPVAVSSLLLLALIIIILTLTTL